MYDLEAICWLCLCENKVLKLFCDIEKGDATYLTKLTESIIEVGYDELTDRRSICVECCDIVNIVYNFREKCLDTKKILTDYIAKLHSDSNVINSKHVVSSSDSKDESIYIKTECDKDQSECLENNYENSFQNDDIKEEIDEEWNQIDDEKYDVSSLDSSIKSEDDTVNINIPEDSSTKNIIIKETTLLKDMRKNLVRLLNANDPCPFPIATKDDDLYPNETDEERKKRLNRERQRRYRINKHKKSLIGETSEKEDVALDPIEDRKRKLHRERQRRYMERQKKCRNCKHCQGQNKCSDNDGETS